MTTAIIGLTKKLDENAKLQDGREGSRRGVRVGRSGKANATDIRDKTESIDALIDSLKEVHKNAKLGSTGLSDFFKVIKNKIDPVNEVFDDLKEVVKKTAITERAHAKQIADAIKSYKGNINEVQKINKLYGEYNEVVQDLIAVQGDATRSQEDVNDALEKETKIRKALNDMGIKIEKSELDKYFQALRDGLAKGTTQVVKDLDSFDKSVKKSVAQYDAGTKVLTSFVDNIGSLQERMDKKFKNDVNQLGSGLLASLKKDFMKIPDLITSRMSAGLQENNFVSAIRMGLSPQELNAFKAQNRVALGSMGGNFDDKTYMGNNNIHDRSNEITRAFGLIGKENSEFLGKQIQYAMRSGQRYTSDTAARANFNTALMQQMTGGTAAEAQARFAELASSDFMTARFAMGSTPEEKRAAEQELVQRVKLTRAMGLEVDYLKKKMQMEKDSRFAGFEEQLRSLSMAQAATSLLENEGILRGSDDKRIWTAIQNGAESSLSGAEQKRGEQIRANVAAFQRSRFSKTNSLIASGNMGDAMSNIVTTGLVNKFIDESSIGGPKAVEIYDAHNRAKNELDVRSDKNTEAYQNEMVSLANQQLTSLGDIENAILKVKTLSQGLEGAPGGSTLGVLGGFGLGMVTNKFGGKILKHSMSKIFPSGGGGILSKMPSSISGMAQGGKNFLGSIFNRGGTKAAASTFPASMPPLPAAGKGLLKSGGKTLGKSVLKKIPLVGAGIGLGFAADRAFNNGDVSGALAEATSGIVSTVPIIGTAASLLIDGGLALRDNATGAERKLMDSLMNPLNAGPAGMASSFWDYGRNKVTEKKSLLDATDAANGVTIDPVTGKRYDSTGKEIEVGLLRQMVDLLAKQNELVEEDTRTTKQQFEDQQKAENAKLTVQQHTQNMINMVNDAVRINT